MREHQEGKNICIIGISRGEEREKREETLFEEIMVENFSNRHLDPGRRKQTSRSRSLESSQTDEPKETQNTPYLKCQKFKTSREF